MPGPLGYAFTQRDKDEFNRIIRKVDSIRGPGVVNNPANISINPPQQRQRGGGSASEDASVGQFIYQSFQMVAQGSAGWRMPRFGPLIPNS